MDVWTRLKPNLDVQWMSCAVWDSWINHKRAVYGAASILRSGSAEWKWFSKIFLM